MCNTSKGSLSVEAFMERRREKALKVSVHPADTEA